MLPSPPDATFLTSPCVVNLTTDSAVPASQNSETLSGSVISFGGASTSTVGFNYGLTSSLGSISTTSTISSPALIIGPMTINGLLCGTQYYYQAFAINSAGTATGTTLNFTTSNCTLPVISSTTTATSVTEISAILNGAITSISGAATSTVGFNYGSTSSYTSTSTIYTITSANTLPLTISPSIVGLYCNTTYHYSLFAVNKVGTATTSDSTFQTSPCPASSSVSVTLDKYSLSAGQTATVTFTFTDPPINFTVGDITASNGVITNLVVTGNPNVYTATFTPTSNINVSSNVITVSPKTTMTNYTVGANPESIAFDGTNMWTVNYGEGSASKITPSGVVTTYAGFGSAPSGIAFDGTNMWLTNNTGNSVSEITPSGATSTFAISGCPYGIAFDGTNMWTANYLGNSVSEISSTGTIINTYSLGSGLNPIRIAFDGTNMWVTNASGNSVTKVTPGGATTTISVGSNPVGIAFDGTNMWTANEASSSVTKVTSTGTTTTFDIANSPIGIAFDGTNMWSANSTGNSVSEISSTGTIIATYNGTGSNPHDIAFDGTNMWTANYLGNNVTKVSFAATGTSSNYSINTIVPAVVNTSVYRSGGHFFATPLIGRILAQKHSLRVETMELGVQYYVEPYDLVLTKKALFLDRIAMVRTEEEIVEEAEDSINTFIPIRRIGTGLTSDDFEIDFTNSKMEYCITTEPETCYINLIEDADFYVIFENPEIEFVEDKTKEMSQEEYLEDLKNKKERALADENYKEVIRINNLIEKEKSKI